MGDRVRERDRLGGLGERLRVGAGLLLGLRLRAAGAGEYDLLRGDRLSRSLYSEGRARPPGLYRRFLSGVGLRRVKIRLRSSSTGERSRRARDTECDPNLISPGEGARMGRERSTLYGEAEPLARGEVGGGARRLGDDGVRALLTGERDVRSRAFGGAVEVSQSHRSGARPRTDALRWGLGRSRDPFPLRLYFSWAVTPISSVFLSLSRPVMIS